jgi:hypothetical protein
MLSEKAQQMMISLKDEFYQSRRLCKYQVKLGVEVRLCKSGGTGGETVAVPKTKVYGISL